jgi:hypothetical protein
VADWLAWEATCEYVHTGSICTDVSYIVETRDIWPVLGEDLLAELVSLAEPCGAETCSLQSKVNPSDACKEASDCGALIHGSPMSPTRSDRSGA